MFPGDAVVNGVKSPGAEQLSWGISMDIKRVSISLLQLMWACGQRRCLADQCRSPWVNMIIERVNVGFLGLVQISRESV